MEAHTGIKIQDSIDAPVDIINNCIKGQQKLLNGFPGESNLNHKKFAEAQNPTDGGLVSITKAWLFLKRIHANPALHKIQQEMIFDHRADVRIPLNRIKTSSKVIPTRVREYSISLGENIQQSKIANRESSFSHFALCGGAGWRLPPTWRVWGEGDSE